MLKSILRLLGLEPPAPPPARPAASAATPIFAQPLAPDTVETDPGPSAYDAHETAAAERTHTDEGEETHGAVAGAAPNGATEWPALPDDYDAAHGTASSAHADTRDDGIRYLEQIDGVWHIRLDDNTVVPIRAGRPVTDFLTGWSARFAYVGFAPVTLVEFVNVGGGEATWFLDETMNRVGDNVARLPEKMVEQIRSRVTSWIAADDGFHKLNAKTQAAIVALGQIAAEGGPGDHAP